jgi:hypothetical protein
VPRLELACPITDLTELDEAAPKRLTALCVKTR